MGQYINTLDKKHIYLILLLVFLAGCSSKNWYLDYGLSEDDLLKDKAIIAAVRAMEEGGYSDRNGASIFLKSIDISEKQTSLLLDQLKIVETNYTRVQILNTLMTSKYKIEALPDLLMGLLSQREGERDFSARHIMSLGCDAETALPMLEVIARNDDFEVESMARASIKEITLDCMAKEKIPER